MQALGLVLGGGVEGLRFPKITFRPALTRRKQDPIDLLKCGALSGLLVLCCTHCVTCIHCDSKERFAALTCADRQAALFLAVTYSLQSTSFLSSICDSNFWPEFVGGNLRY
jgi:hypothetical protein